MADLVADVLRRDALSQGSGLNVVKRIKVDIFACTYI